MASITLYPKWITANSNFSGIISANGTGSASYDIPVDGCYIGLIAFNTSALHGKSEACKLTGYSVSYGQRCNINQWSKLYWRLNPQKIIDYSTSGNTISASVLTGFGRTISSDTTGDGWLDKGGAFVDSKNVESVDKRDLFGGTNLLGFYLYGDNDHSVGSYKLHMRNLRASVTYEQRYYARFWDEDGNQLGDDQDLASGVMATAPTTDNQGQTLSRDGYTIAWECDQVHGEYNNIYTAGHLPTSTETDLDFHLRYLPINRIVAVKDVEKGSVLLYKYVNDDWQLQTENSYEYGNHYYTFQHGDHIKIVADGVTTAAEDLVVRLGDIGDDEISTTTVNGASSTTLDAFETQSITRHYIVTLTAQTHYFTITTSAGAGGTITSTRRVTRTGSTTINVTPTAGYRIASVKIDNVSQTIANDQSFSYAFTNVQADHTVEATFARIQYTITFDLPSGVSVTADETAVSGNALTVNHGDTIEFAFSCGSSMSLTGLFLDSSTDSLMAAVFKQVQEETYTLYSITGAHTLKVTATSDLVTIGITQPNQAYGTITGETGKYIRQASGSTNTLTFTVTENVGYGFVKWDDDSTTRPLVFAPTADRTVSATFEALDQVTRAFVNAQKPYYKDATAQDKLIVPFIGGKISAKGQTSKDVTISAKTSDTTAFSFVADPGFEFESALVRYYDSADPDLSHPDRTETTTSNPFSLHDLSAKRVQIEAYFQRLTYEVDVTPKEEAKTPDGTCTVSVLPQAYVDETHTDPKQYFFESELTLTATPGEGWYFRKWSDEGGNAKNIREITVSTANISLQAIFEKYTFDQHFDVEEGGSVTIDGQPVTDVTAEYGDDLLLVFTADIGQKIKDVLVDGVSVFEDVTLTRRGGTYLLTHITAAHTVAVVFAPRIYTNGRKLLDYYPPVIASIVDIQRLMAAYQVSIDALWDAVSFLQENQYIDTATDEGVSLWERELGIIPAATDTLTQRKARLRLKWVPSNNFTTKWLHGWLEEVCGTTVPWPEVEDYTLKVTLPWFASWWTIFNDLRTYKPANIVLDPVVSMPDSKINLLTGFAVATDFSYETSLALAQECLADWLDWLEEYTESEETT